MAEEGTTKDVEMAEAASSSPLSSLSSPPSHLSDDPFCLSPPPAQTDDQDQSQHKEEARKEQHKGKHAAAEPGHNEPELESKPLHANQIGNEQNSDHDISLDPISFSSTTPSSNTADTEPMVTTRGASRRAAGKEAHHDGDGAFDLPPLPKVTVKKPPKKAATARKKWTAERLLTDSKSPLAKAGIRDMLCKPAAWNILTPDERADILAAMPPGMPVLAAGTSDARPDMALLRSDDNFRHDCARYAENLEDGKHDPDWLAEAWAAHEQRRAGEFDEYLEHKFEEDWGVDLADEREIAAAATRERGEGKEGTPEDGGDGQGIDNENGSNESEGKEEPELENKPEPERNGDHEDVVMGEENDGGGGDHDEDDDDNGHANSKPGNHGDEGHNGDGPGHNDRGDPEQYTTRPTKKQKQEGNAASV